MSYVVKKGSVLGFGNGGVNSSLRESGHVCTLCADCIDKTTGQDCFIDLHLTVDQLHLLMKNALAAYSDYAVPSILNPGDAE